MNNIGREMFPEKIFVPPSCPHTDASIYQPGDIKNATMAFYAGDFGSNSEANPTTTEAFASFRDRNDKMLFDCLTLETPIDSQLSDAARELGKQINNDGQVVANRLHTELCAQVLTCRGKRANGECWALGPEGFGNAILRAMDASGEPSA